jgi:hypothetical protein
MWLDDAFQHLGWPKPDQVKSPSGGGPSHYARQVEQKIGAVLRRQCSLSGVQTGILTADPAADSAESPLAIVLQFDQPVSDDVLREAHRLCWNFSRTALLVTLEPNRIQAWTCTLAPRKIRRLNKFRVLPPLELTKGETPASVLQTEAAQVLHWVNLISGEFLRQHESKFRKEERADAMLVSNLRAVRKQLLIAGLDRDICHALLARLIFTQFLFQRTDSDGRPAISQTTLDGRFDNTLKKVYEHATALGKILESKEETYALFHWLNEKFNGDLFPGKGQTEEEREVEWKREKRNVTFAHLNILAEFVSGTINLDDRQQSMWPEYSFDTLPLEFISSVYEEFLNEDQLQLSAYYTPPHLVDFVLDGVLPWGGKEWDLRIIDPCCGSAIFLVKAFQRLVQRWKNAHPGEEPRVDDLRGLLINNLLGVDASGEAIRVASFSLCLALCDAIDPKHYWKQTLFPPLRSVRLIESDFFAENHEAFRTKEAGVERKWDLVIGNAPWRGGALEDDSPGMKWAKTNGWPVSNRNPGPLFLAKAAAITKPEGRISMIQPAATVLYQRSSEATDSFRRKLFGELSVEEIVSFAHLRWQLFNAKSPTCLVTLRPVKPSTNAEVIYICPKPQYSSEDDMTISVERHDIHKLTQHEAATDSTIWTVLLSGSRRDFSLVQALRTEASFAKLRAQSKDKAQKGQVLLIRRGVQRGKGRQRDEPSIVGRRMLEKPEFPSNTGLWLDGDSLPKNNNPRVEDISDFSSFELPQLVIKQSILKEVGRFQSALVKSPKEKRGILVSKSYTSVHQFADGDNWLRSGCLMFRSRLCAYFLALTSRLAFDRGEALFGDLLDVPIPTPISRLTTDDLNLTEVDGLVEQAFGLREPERAMIGDLLDFVYREGGREGNERPGRAVTLRDSPNEFGDLHHYADFLLKTLRATFGKDRAVRATVFEESPTHNRLPIRMVAIHLNWPQRRTLLTKESIPAGQLRREMAKFYKDQLGVRTRQSSPITSGLGFQRVARLFIDHQAETGVKIPTVFYLKPDQRRYWTRSQALRDADELAATIIASSQRRRTRK